MEFLSEKTLFFKFFFVWNSSLKILLDFFIFPCPEFLSEKTLDFFMFSISLEFLSEKTLNFLCFSCLKLFEKSLKFLWFSLSGIYYYVLKYLVISRFHVWNPCLKKTLNISKFPVWNPCLKRLWMFSKNPRLGFSSGGIFKNQIRSQESRPPFEKKNVR